MPIMRRSRLVTFRVCPDEYDILAKACAGLKARSISEFARAAVMERLRTIESPARSLTGDLLGLTRELSELDVSIEETQRRIRNVLGLGHPEMAGE
jgi:hypothetical protein